MPLNSFIFGVFFIGTFLGFWFLPVRLRLMWLVFASMVLVSSFGVDSLVVFSAALLWTYVWGRAILGSRLRLALGVGGLVLLLALFKYHTMLFGNSSFNGMPVGISFYVFTLIGYLVDVWRRAIQPEKRIEKLALFGGFFPKFMAGPIERYHDFYDKSNWKSFSRDRLVSGLQLFALGLFKKLVIADNLGIVVDKVFGNLSDFRGLSLVVAVFLYAWQIYADFSGYTDMARGVARMLGVDLGINFKNPYTATSVGDFWRRWHISLSHWLRDYVYIPLGGSRGGRLRTAINTLLVFVVCGLWHGGAITFFWWGLWHGGMVALERLVKEIFSGQRWKFFPLLSRAYAFGAVSVGWVLFRSESMTDAWYVLNNAFVGARHFVEPDYIMATVTQMFRTNGLEMGITGLVLAVIMAYEWLSSRYDLLLWLRGRKTMTRWVIYVGWVLAILLLRNAQITEYIYVRF